MSNFQVSCNYVWCWDTFWHYWFLIVLVVASYIQEIWPMVNKYLIVCINCIYFNNSWSFAIMTSVGYHIGNCYTPVWNYAWYQRFHIFSYQMRGDLSHDMHRDLKIVSSNVQRFGIYNVQKFSISNVQKISHIIWKN